MESKYILVAAMLSVAACGNGGGSSNSGSGGTSTSSSDVPASLAGNLESAEFDQTNETLTITLPPFDGSPGTADYNRNAALDVGSFQAYDLEENQSSRRYIAMFKSGNHVKVGAVGTEYYLANQYGGTIYGRVGVYDTPSEGVATYEGDYAAVLTVPQANPGDGPSRVSGDAQLIVDFNQALVEGQVTGRTIVDDGTSLDDVVLRATALENGAFFGDVTNAAAKDLGDYGGVIGGPNAEEVGAVLVFTPDDLGTDPANTEYGAFVGDQTCITSPGVTCP